MFNKDGLRYLKVVGNKSINVGLHGVFCEREKPLYHHRHPIFVYCRIEASPIARHQMTYGNVMSIYNFEHFLTVVNFCRAVGVTLMEELVGNVQRNFLRNLPFASLFIFVLSVYLTII